MSRARRRQLWAATAPVFLCFIGASGSAQSESAEVRAALDIVNRSATPIIDARLASRAMASWGDNLLSSHLEPGQRRRVDPAREEGCLYSVHVVYKDKRFERFVALDLCRNHEFVFAAKAAQPLPSQGGFTAPPSAKVNLVNRSSKTVNYLRMAPVGSRMLGPDRLGSGTLGPGQHINVPLDDHQGCVYRIRAFYEDNLSEIVPSADLCDKDSIVFKGTELVNSSRVPANMRLETTNTIFLSNQSGARIDWAYVYPRTDRDRGPDRLGRDVLPSGNQMRIDVSDITLCFVSILAVYHDHREERLSNFDLCAAHEPTIAMRGPSGEANPHGVPSRP